MSHSPTPLLPYSCKGECHSPLLPYSLSNYTDATGFDMTPDLMMNIALSVYLLRGLVIFYYAKMNIALCLSTQRPGDFLLCSNVPVSIDD
ncbi:MAG: hypothetical protein SWX82_20365 [Cyanobacteriota bacterium]|nr:hypothetical protein [Cyanobacteriota bacterium]